MFIEDDLEYDYNVKDDKEREFLMYFIIKLCEEFLVDEVGKIVNMLCSLVGNIFFLVFFDCFMIGFLYYV